MGLLVGGFLLFNKKHKIKLDSYAYGNSSVYFMPYGALAASVFEETSTYFLSYSKISMAVLKLAYHMDGAWRY